MLDARYYVSYGPLDKLAGYIPTVSAPRFRKDKSDAAGMARVLGVLRNQEDSIDDIPRFFGVYQVYSVSCNPNTTRHQIRKDSAISEYRAMIKMRALHLSKDPSAEESVHGDLIHLLHDSCQPREDVISHFAGSSIILPERVKISNVAEMPDFFEKNHMLPIEILGRFSDLSNDGVDPSEALSLLRPEIDRMDEEGKMYGLTVCEMSALYCLRNADKYLSDG